MYSTENAGYVGNGWGPLWGAVIGGVGGYLIGRNNGFGGYPYNGNPNGLVNGCQTCFQSGEYAGKSAAGIEFIATKVNDNATAIRAVDLNVTNRFEALAQQKINDLMAENNALKTQAGFNGISCQLGALAHSLDSITTGCAVRSVPACPVCPVVPPAPAR